MICINNIIFYSNGRKLVALQLKNNNIRYIDVIYESGVDIYSIAAAEINGLLCLLIAGDEDTCRCIALPQWFTKEFMPEMVIRATQPVYGSRRPLDLTIAPIFTWDNAPVR